ncbi:nucleotide-sugar transporter family protein [Striga asiatica]|uniref:Nucleotide-sugar transporter family protein n=1 Tax=Striga asiatica TaxID=4170 RepID=A0A5A7RGR4_STRAF|nr:nucleotide-sugar transporter family protein [Striga asiatica]
MYSKLNRRYLLLHLSPNHIDCIFIHWGILELKVVRNASNFRPHFNPFFFGNGPELIYQVASSILSLTITGTQWLTIASNRRQEDGVSPAGWRQNFDERICSAHKVPKRKGRDHKDAIVQKNRSYNILCQTRNFHYATKIRNNEYGSINFIPIMSESIGMMHRNHMVSPIRPSPYLPSTGAWIPRQLRQLIGRIV